MASRLARAAGRAGIAVGRQGKSVHSLQQGRATTAVEALVLCHSKLRNLELGLQGVEQLRHVDASRTQSQYLPG